VLIDPYADAFNDNPHQRAEWQRDQTEMKRGVQERKWKLDSPSYVIRLAHGYWRPTQATRRRSTPSGTRPWSLLQNSQSQR